MDSMDSMDSMATFNEPSRLQVYLLTFGFFWPQKCPEMSRKICLKTRLQLLGKCSETALISIIRTAPKML